MDSVRRISGIRSMETLYVLVSQPVILMLDIQA